ncbi:hypothetical protein V8E55_003872 [Tylopilus felleus]
MSSVWWSGVIVIMWWDGRWQSCWCDGIHMVVVVSLLMSSCHHGVIILALAVSCGGGSAGMSCLSLQPRALGARPRCVMHCVGKALSVIFTSSSLWYLSMSLLCCRRQGVLTTDEREADYIINYIQSSVIESTQEHVSRPVNLIRLLLRLAYGEETEVKKGNTRTGVAKKKAEMKKVET